MTSEKISEGLVQANASGPALSEKFISAAEWSPIETAPKDGRQFLALQNGDVYQAKFFDGRFGFRTHALRVASKYRIVDAELDGRRVKAQVAVEEPWDEVFRHDWCLWTRGFDFHPSHWMPLASFPTAQVNFSNEAGSDPVSLNQSLSESIRSLTKAGKGE